MMASHNVESGPISRRYLYITVFTAGMTTLAVEFTTSRMLQTVYGTSNIVWANVIGLVLFFLTLGYFIGGKLADRHPNYRTFYVLVTSAGFASIVFLLLTSYILRAAASALAAVNLGAIAGSLIGVILALSIPVTLLGCVSPFAIRLGVRDIREAGRISGRIYAVSTWGSLLGTYLPVLIAIPLIGTRVTSVIFGLVLIVVGLRGMWRTNRPGALGSVVLLLVILPLSLLFSRGNIKEQEGQIYETESAYNYIQVIRRDGCNYLLLNEGQAYHSYYCDKSNLDRVSVWSMMLAAPYFTEEAGQPPIQNMAVIGLAAGTIPKLFTEVYGPVPIDGIELDPAIVETGQTYFGLDEPNIRVIVGDGRYELNRLDKSYDLITLDAYKVPYIPWHLTTVEFFQEMKERLTGNGVVAVNVGRAPEDRRLVEAVTATLMEVFPSVLTIDVPATLNSILVATVQPSQDDTLVSHLSLLEDNRDSHPLLLKVLRSAEANLVRSTGSSVVFRDQRAPVETIIDSLVIKYLLTEGVSGLQDLGSG